MIGVLEPRRDRHNGIMEPLADRHIGATFRGKTPGSNTHSSRPVAPSKLTSRPFGNIKKSRPEIISGFDSMVDSGLSSSAVSYTHATLSLFTLVVLMSFSLE